MCSGGPARDSALALLPPNEPMIVLEPSTESSTSIPSPIVWQADTTDSPGPPVLGRDLSIDDLDELSKMTAEEVGAEFMEMLKGTMVDAPSYSSLGAAPAKEEDAPVFRSLGAAPPKKVDEPVSENALNTIHDALDNFKEALMNKCRRGRKEALLAALKPVLCSAENRAAIRKICAVVA